MDHRLIEGLMEAIAPVIRESNAAAIDNATAPLLARIDALEQRQPERGEKGEPGEPGKDGEPGEKGEPGRDGVDGKDGAAGRDGVDGKDGAQGERGEAGEPGRDGVDGKEGHPGRDGRDGLPGVQGEKGRDGIDGKDGRDGLSPDDFEIELADDDRTLVVRLVRGEIAFRHDIVLPIVLDKGVWKQGEYVRGDGVTYGGSFWIAQRATDAEPDTPDCGWRLAVKRGRSGKDFRPDDQRRQSEPIRFR